MSTFKLILQGFQDNTKPVGLKLISGLNLLFVLFAGGFTILWVLAGLLYLVFESRPGIHLPGDEMTNAIVMTVSAALSIFGIVVTRDLLGLQPWARAAQVYWYLAAAVWCFFYGIASAINGPGGFGADRILLVGVMIAAVVYLRSEPVAQVFRTRCVRQNGAESAGETAELAARSESL